MLTLGCKLSCECDQRSCFKKIHLLNDISWSCIRSFRKSIFWMIFLGAASEVILWSRRHWPEKPCIVEYLKLGNIKTSPISKTRYVLSYIQLYCPCTICTCWKEAFSQIPGNFLSLPEHLKAAWPWTFRLTDFFCLLDEWMRNELAISVPPKLPPRVHCWYHSFVLGNIERNHLCISWYVMNKKLNAWVQYRQFWQIPLAQEPVCMHLFLPDKFYYRMCSPFYIFSSKYSWLSDMNN